MDNKCRIRLLIIIALLAYIYPNLLARNNLLIYDCDGDGVSDTVYIDTLSYLNEKTNESRIICKLSTKQFQPIMSSYIYYDPENFDSWYLSIAQNNFLYSSAGMRQGEDYSFSYEKDTRKIRLTQAYYYAYGNATNDGAQDITIDLLSGKISGKEYFYDYNKKKLKKYKVNKKKTFMPIYLEDFSTQVYLLDD